MADDDLIAIEDNAAKAVADPIKLQLQAIMREMTKRYVLAFGSVYAREVDQVKLSELTTWLHGELQNIDLDHIPKQLKKASKTAWVSGIKSAHKDLRESVGKIPQPALSEETYQILTSAVDESRKKLVEAAEMVRTAERWGDLTLVMAKANQSVTSATGTAKWTTNRVAAEAVTHVAKATENVTQVWRPERTACVHCLAYAGVTALPGEPFPPGLTFGEKAIKTEPFAGPPLHRVCRCRLGIIAIDDDRIPAALKREAERSIAKGFKLESESEKTRLKAIQKLLDGDSVLPATVLNEARRKLKQGRLT